MEKQLKIVEMAKDICRVQHNCDNVCKPISACDALRYAERAVEAGYVKQIEGVNLLDDTPSLFECSVCHWSDGDTYTGDTSEYNYCPNCGAKMKGGSEMEETKIFACDNGRSYRFPAQHCLFCGNCTHVLYDYTHGPYLWLCDLGEKDFRTCGKFKEEVE